jgi:transposase-like protein
MSKLTKEERVAKQERREKLKELLGEAVDLQGVNDLVTNLRKEIIEMTYDEEMKNHLGFAKSASRPGNCDNLKGLDDAVKSCHPNADHQKCIAHQIRNSDLYDYRAVHRMFL